MVRSSADVRTASGVASKTPVSVARASRSASPARTSPARSGSPCTTTVAVVPSAGKRSAIARNVVTSGIESGSVSRFAACSFMPTAGALRASTASPETTRAATGRRTTGASRRLLSPPRPIRRLSRHSSGTRGRSTQRPSLASSAGSTVIEPSTAIATTRMAPVASESKVAPPTTYRPVIEAITASPETMMECPEVAAAISTASTVPAPRARSSRSRLRKNSE